MMILNYLAMQLVAGVVSAGVYWATGSLGFSCWVGSSIIWGTIALRLVN